MVQIKYPPTDFLYKKISNRDYIFDVIRKKWVLLTPEEWVRQNFLQYLLKVEKYPMGLLAVEKKIDVIGLSKRFDILVYDISINPFLMVECKAPYIQLGEATLHQVLRYNIALPVPYCCITNGVESYLWYKKDGELVEVDSFPNFLEIK